MRSAKHIWRQETEESAAQAIHFTPMALHLSTDDYREGFDNA